MAVEQFMGGCAAQHAAHLRPREPKCPGNRWSRCPEVSQRDRDTCLLPCLSLHFYEELQESRPSKASPVCCVPALYGTWMSFERNVGRCSQPFCAEVRMAGTAVRAI